MMADELDGIDFGQDFEDFAVGLSQVTIRQIDPDTGAVTATLADVPAAKLPRRRGPFGVSGGEVGQDERRFVFRADLLTFVPKGRDQVVEASGTVWDIERAEIQGLESLCSVDVVLKRT